MARIWSEGLALSLLPRSIRTVTAQTNGYQPQGNPVSFST